MSLRTRDFRLLYLHTEGLQMDKARKETNQPDSDFIWNDLTDPGPVRIMAGAHSAPFLCPSVYKSRIDIHQTTKIPGKRQSDTRHARGADYF